MERYKAYVIIGGLGYQVASKDDEDDGFTRSEVESAIKTLNKRKIEYLETHDGGFVVIPDGTEYHIVFRKVL